MTPTPYEQARSRKEAAKKLVEESRVDYLTAKKSDHPKAFLAVLTAASLLADAYCSFVECEDAFEEIVLDEDWKAIQAEREMTVEEVLDRAG
jgi:hypothetical protein